jgi:uncharacterized lipoprotein YmbA
VDRLAWIVAALIASMLTGCASPPVALIALPAPAASAQSSDETSGPTIVLRAVTLPGYLEGFPVVLGRTNGVLVVSEQSEWAERLSVGVARVLRDALSQRLGAERTLIAGDGRRPDAHLTIEFLSLDPAGDTLNLDARWFFACASTAQGRAGRTQLQVPLSRTTPQAIALTTSAALTLFADRLAASVPCARL